MRYWSVTFCLLYEIILDFKHGGREFFYYHGKKPVYIDLVVNAKDIDRVLEQMKLQTEIEYSQRKIP